MRAQRGKGTMARSVRDAKLDSRAARERLGARGKPYFRTLDQGLHLGYRRLKGAPGRWVVRYYVGEQSYKLETIATADDLSGANGVDVLDFRQAQDEARRRRDDRVRTAAGVGPFTVTDAMAKYIEALAAKGRKTADTQFRANTMILPSLGSQVVAELTTERIRRWVMELASTSARVRTGKGKTQRYRAVTDEPDVVRRRRSTANRLLAILRAALTHAWREGKVSSDQAWRRVKPFENVSSARIRYLAIAESKRLINACDPGFRDLVQAALQTGCRYGELSRLKVGDLNPDSGTVAILESKTGRSRHVVLTEEGAAFFAELCAGRPGSEPLLRRPSGATWGPSNQTVPLNKACLRAGISPPVNFHALRHTYASHAVMAGAPLHVVGKNLGHADTRMVERHYGHMAPSYVANEIRRAAPRFGLRPGAKVAAL
jgi:integrase